MIITNIEPIIKLNEEWNQKKNLIITGVPHSGKTTAINSLDPKHRTAIPDIYSISSLEDIDNILIDTRPIHIEVPKNFIEENIEEWREKLKKTSNLRTTTIIEGRSYVITCLLTNKKLFDIKNQEIKSFVDHLLIQDNTELFSSYNYGFNKETALRFMRSISNSIEHEIDNILEYSKYSSEKDDIYIPQLITDAINRVIEDDSYLTYFENQKNYVTFLSPKKKNQKNFVNHLTDIPFDSIEKLSNLESVKQIIGNFVNTIGSFASLVATSLSLINPIMIIVPIVIFGVKTLQNFREKKIESSLESMISLYESWNKIPPVRKDLICYSYDQLLNLLPGTTERSFSQLFEINKDIFVEKIKEISNKLDDLQLKIHELNKKIDIEIAQIKKEVLKLKGVILDSSQLGTKVVNDEVEIEYSKEDKKFVKIVIEKELNDIEHWVNENIENKKILVITGAHGIGKSVLARYITTKKLELHNMILSIDHIPIHEVDNILYDESFKNAFVLYDPSNPSIYLPKKEFQNSNMSGLDIDTIHEKISSLINANAKGLIILPTDIWDMIHPKLNNIPMSLDITNDLRSANFIERIIGTYSLDCKVQKTELKNITSKILEYRDGYTLVAAYLGRWLNKNGGIISDVNSAIDNAQKEPVRFLQNYVWAAIINKDHNIAKDLALPLLVHVYLGEMTPQLSSELPTSIQGYNLRSLRADLAKWISNKHEDLMELALKKIVNNETHETILPEIRDMYVEIKKIKDIFGRDHDSITKKIISHLQEWLSIKANNLSEIDLDEFLEYYASTLVWVYTDSQFKINFINYFARDDFSLPSASSLLLFGFEYNTNDFLDFLNHKYNYSFKLIGIVDNIIKKSEEEFDGNLLIKAFSYVLGISCETNEPKRSLTSIKYSVAFLSLITRQYSHFVNRIYWKTGRRIMTKCVQNLNNSDEELAAFLADYQFVLVMICNITPEQLGQKIFLEFTNKEYWFNKIMHIVTTIRLSRTHNNKKEFENMIQRLLDLKKNLNNKEIYQIAIFLAGPEIVIFYDSLNLLTESSKWYNHIQLEINELKKIGTNNQIVRTWLNSTQFLTSNYNNIDEDYMNKKLELGIIDLDLVNARFAYRENRLNDAINIIKDSINKRSELLPDDISHIISRRIMLSHYELLKDRKDIKNDINEIWNITNNKTHYIPPDTFEDVLSHYMIVIDDDEFCHIFKEHTNRIKSNSRRAIVFGNRLLNNFNRFFNLECEFIKSLQGLSIEKASPFLKPVIMYLLGIYNEQEAITECKSLDTDKESHKLSQIYINITRRITNKQNLNIMPFEEKRYKVDKLFDYPEVLIYGLALLGYTSGSILLLIYAYIKHDNILMNQLFNHLKLHFKIPVIDMLISNLQTLESNSNIDDFKKEMSRLLVVAL